MWFTSKKKKDENESLEKGLEKTSEGLLSRLKRAVAGKTQIDDDALDDIEEALILADVGTDTTIEIIRRIEERVRKDKYVSTSELYTLLREEIKRLLHENLHEDDGGTDVPRPQVFLFVGVNGVGKTTTIGRLAYRYQQEGLSVLMGAADTFRAAATEQLTLWAERLGLPIVSKQQGADPASVAHETVQQALATGADVALIDTAGRLHNKVGLMDELAKIHRVSLKALSGRGSVRTFLVLDASTGMNALEQARQFTRATHVDALILTKLDGTAKGGVVLSIAHQLSLPIAYIGIGEKAQDLQPFSADDFLQALIPTPK